MKRKIQLLFIVFVLACSDAPEPVAVPVEPAPPPFDPAKAGSASPVTIEKGAYRLVPGISEGDPDATDPLPSESRFFKTMEGGVLLLETGAGAYLKLAIREQPPKKYQIRIEWPNPTDPENPVLSASAFPAQITEFLLSTPGAIPGFEIGKDYIVRVTVYESIESKDPIDVLGQKFRSYADTTGEQTLLLDLSETK